MQQALNHEDLLDDTEALETEVQAILDDYFMGEVPSPTATSVGRGRAKTIIRDAANDD